MAIKKSELYSSLWASCDELRGGMDASQYKDYVLVLLFIKYISDKYAGQPFAPITIPAGASFADMVALKGKPDIGDQINKKIIVPLKEANKLDIKADFNDPALLGFLFLVKQKAIPLFLDVTAPCDGSALGVGHHGGGTGPALLAKLENGKPVLYPLGAGHLPAFDVAPFEPPCAGRVAGFFPA